MSSFQEIGGEKYGKNITNRQGSCFIYGKLRGLWLLSTDNGVGSGIGNQRYKVAVGN